MPIYEYACPDCGHRFERMQKFSDDPVKDCPECSAGNVKKLISASAFVLKGGGWYKDHYGLKSTASDSGGGAASGSKESGGSDSGSKESSSSASTASSAPAPASTSSPTPAP